MSSIQSINAVDISKITSGQVIIDLKSIIKELIENAIDAATSKIVVNFINYGIESITVQDNGKGIQKEDFETVCLRSHTSKINDLDDLTKLGTLGFRGEALNSICALSTKVTITTSTLDTYPRNYTLKYDQLGKLKEESSKLGGMSNKSGTTITIEHLFKNFTVRRKNFIKNSKREFHKAVNFIINYLLIYPEIKFEVTNTNSSGKKQLVLSSKGGENNTTVENLITIYGNNGNTNLLNVDIDIGFNAKLTGYISSYSFGLGRSTPDRQFLFVNKRPIVFRKLTKLINEVYKSFNHVQYPIYVLNLDIDPELIDVNVLPDKTNVLIHNESRVLESIRESLIEFYTMQDKVIIPKSLWEHIPFNKHGTATVEQTSTQEDTQARTIDIKKFIKKEEDSIDSLETQSSEARNEHINEANEAEKSVGSKEFEIGQADKSTAKTDPLFCQEPENECPVKVEKPLLATAQAQRRICVEVLRSVDERNMDKGSVGQFESQEIELDHSRNVPEETIVETENDYDQDDEVEEEKSESVYAISHNSVATSNQSITSDVSPPEKNKELGAIKNQASDAIPTSQVLSNFSYNGPEIQTDISKLQDNHGVNFHPKQSDACEGSLYIKIGNEEFEERPAKRFKSSSLYTKKKKLSSQELLSTISSPRNFDSEEVVKRRQNIKVNQTLEDEGIYHISKSDFLKMKLVGQFNLGFILVHHRDNLFIIDQHASDEKYNFEKLIENYSIQNQPLIRPQTLELNIIDEMLVIDHEAVFRHNGFKFTIDHEGKLGSRIVLISLPVYKNIMFDTNDFMELINLVNEQPSNKHIKCSKIRNILAMKACRSSIMIGSPLSRGKMTQVVQNLSRLDKPWNCPHGRPTMRHLSELDNWNSKYFDYSL
ncbi:Pms1 DNA mismatch repair factor [Candida orthopsilosis Co 90-125]|uniref:Pms1 DNA mismatch repair factor n=1 Tax=Candida orthopsilosis (strain 90-125) TaxID=1136231 RepID=H8X3M6_CANO9|nr:Pms1 DNA mismatch repair factor [Candida orthopsilosis Co 90-125]CCG25664.1 Pms1 DNA mismatch repair factor [Candida orthopsilosis Co 90-125]